MKYGDQLLIYDLYEMKIDIFLFEKLNILYDTWEGIV